jgi:hypothetical protein
MVIEMVKWMSTQKAAQKGDCFDSAPDRRQWHIKMSKKRWYEKWQK